MLTDYRSLDALQARIDIHQRYSERVDDIEAEVNRAVALAPEMSLLDVGCGTGDYLRRLASGGHRGALAAADTSPAAISAVRGVPGVTAQLADAQALPWPDRTFDVVTARHMLYHVPDPVAAIGEAHRVLRPGGVIAAVVNVVDATPMLLGLAAGAVAAHGLDPSVFRIGVDSRNLPAMVERVFGHAQVERHDNALVFDAPEPVIAYAVSCLAGFGVSKDHPLWKSIVDTIIAEARELFPDNATRRDPKGYVIVTARRSR